MIRPLLFLLLLVMAAAYAKAGDGFVTYPKEEGTTTSKVFSVKVNGADVFVQSFKDIHYLRFAHNKKLTIEVTCSENIESVEISPGKHITGKQTNGNTIVFGLDKPGYHVLTLNGRERLFILTDAVEKKQKNTNWISVEKFGVHSSPTELQTGGIQKALNEAAAKKQVLYFPVGIYRTGTIQIPGNSTVYLSAGAMIKGSEKREDYPIDEGRKESDEVNDKANYTDNGEWMTFSRLIFINNVENVKIFGPGIIDGSGSVLRRQGKPANLIRIRNSKNVVIEDVLLRDPACWNTHILYSENVTIRNVKMINDRSVANTDGFDPDASKNVLIDHCFAYCSDDNVAVKTTNNGGLLQDCENITVSNCVFLTKKSALKVGTETKGAFMKNIRFNNNYVVEADRGLVLYCYDGASFQDIQFTGNYLEKGFPDSQKKAIHFQIRKRSGEGSIKNVLIKDCVFSESFHSASEIVGLNAAHTIDGIKIKNLKIGGKLCLGVEDLRLKTNEYVHNISFEK
jgi:polygalacturonase